jgi:hypothetical protein
MRDLTIHELDEQLGERLPARELMGTWNGRKKFHNGGDQTAVAIGGDGGNNVPIASPQINAVNVAIAGDATQVNNQSADGGDAFAGNFR